MRDQGNPWHTRLFFIQLWVLALYATALAAERLDHEVFAAGGWISGHTVKHMLAAVAVAWLSRMLRLRSPAPV